MPTALVTGASGFLGPYVVEALARTGWSLRLATRRPTPETANIAVAVGDIGSQTDWAEALAGVDAVVHLAARAHRPAAVQDAESGVYVETNTAGTLRLARSAADAGIRRFVFMSSIAVNGATTEGRAPFREDGARAPVTVYGRTKAEAEVGLERLAATSSMAVTIIRPPLVYGRAAKGSFRLLKRALGLHLPLPFSRIGNRRAFVAAENLADFVAFNLGVPASGCSRYIVADEEQVSTPEFVRRLAAAMRVSALLFPLPASAIRAALTLVGRAEMADGLLGSLKVDTAATRAAGWRPPLGMAEALERAVRD